MMVVQPKAQRKKWQGLQGYLSFQKPSYCFGQESSNNQIHNITIYFIFSFWISLLLKSVLILLKKLIIISCGFACRKLVLYPNGNKSKNIKDHVSVYLALADSSSLGPGWEVSAVFRLYLLDQNKDSYLILQGRLVVASLHFLYK